MDLSIRKIGFSALLAVAAAAAPASAQMLEWQDRVYVSVNGGVQAGSQEFEQALAFGLYGEAATLRVPHNIDSGGLFDVGGGVRVTNNVGVGVSVTRFTSSQDVTVDAALPHPLFFNLPRPATAGVSDVDHSQLGVHIQALYVVPLSDRIDIAFSGGPSIISVDQTVVTGLTLQQPEIPPFQPNITSVGVKEVSDTAVGFNVGADWTYLITSPQASGAMPSVGAGVMIRYASATADLPEVPDIGTQDLDVGGFQIGAGIRIRWR